MGPISQMGVAVFKSTDATTFTEALTTTLSENIGVILTIVAVVFAINFARKMFNRGLRGKV